MFGTLSFFKESGLDHHFENLCICREIDRFAEKQTQNALGHSHVPLRYTQFLLGTVEESETNFTLHDLNQTQKR